MASDEGAHDEPHARHRRWLAGSLAPLAGRAYRLLWVGQSVSSAGDALVQVALVLAILRVGGTAAEIGYVAAIATVTRAVFSLVGGVWADRLQRQMVMLASDVLRAGVQGVLAVLLITGQARVWQLGLGTAVYGAAQAFFGPASAGLMPELVPAGQLQRANALMTISGSFVSVGGPAAAGVLVAVFGPGVVFAIDAASFLVSAVSLGMLRLPPRQPAERGSFRADLAAGWHELAIRPWYCLNLIAHALWNFAIPAYFVLGPVIAVRLLGGDSAWGAISAAFAAGAVAGGLIALRAHPRRPLVAGNFALAAGVLPMLALAPPLATWVIAAAATLAGAGFTFLNTTWATTMQALIPEQVRSRVDSYDWLISVVVMPAGMALVGPLAAAVGNGTTLVSAALVMGIPCALTFLIPGVRGVRRHGDGTITGPEQGQPLPQPATEYTTSTLRRPPPRRRRRRVRGRRSARADCARLRDFASIGEKGLSRQCRALSWASLSAKEKLAARWRWPAASCAARPRATGIREAGSRRWPGRPGGCRAPRDARASAGVYPERDLRDDAGTAGAGLP